MKNVTVMTILFLLLLLAGTVDLQAQCAMCGATVQSSEDAEIYAGLNRGILYLLVIPYLILTGFTIVIVRSLKRSKINENTTYFPN